jgi:cytochrome c553
MRLAAASCAAMMIAAVLGGCSQPASVAGRFDNNGQLIAMSGADAGADNACFTCHGLDGGGNGAGAPRLAGLDSGYLTRQLEAYADGRRSHETMSWIAGRLTPTERLKVAAYYASLPVPIEGETKAQPVPAIYIAGDPARDLTACAACHGLDGGGSGAVVPPLAHQPAAYLAEQLETWKRGNRRNDPGNMMLEISRKLTPAEVQAVADYASALPGDRRRQAPAEASLPERRRDPRNDASAPPRYAAAPSASAATR